MPRIRGSSIEEHHEMVWADLAEAMRQLLLERDYGAITMGHVAARAGLARNTLYNYARDMDALAFALTERVSRPLVGRVTAIAARPGVPAAERMRAIIAAVLEAATDPALRPMFWPGGPDPGRAGVRPGLPVSPAATCPDQPFHTIVTEVENLVRDGIAHGEFRPVDNIPLTVELLAGAMRAAAERVGRSTPTLPETTQAAQTLILTSLSAPPG
ncbi:TetR/AcrR family transcriptional regulator [Actinocorallia sp. A-T 12471]|uniref:TetR/AcrR family transcriptional regulator n=1 Tax=Actinocorallia sp. A-T 12471 TaxID=3089813 RepID=UPI0029D37756|nr:TetR/AcrR family transcriptional regulator [Actinocorallia sp. A-T 12471]MDX6740632.1 TetR/AcrR family transcriptional regulator [Actinocorallia sp. A-T 12471]